MSDTVTAEGFADVPTPETANSANEAIARLLVAPRSRPTAPTQGEGRHDAAAELATRLRATRARDVLAAYGPEPGIA